MNQNQLWIIFLLGLFIFVFGNGFLNFLGIDSEIKEGYFNYGGSCDPYYENPLPWFYRFLPFPYLRPAYYRNYGEVLDPYYQRYYQTYYNDLPYYYYHRNSFDRYRKVWGQRNKMRRHDQKRQKSSRKHLHVVPAAKCNRHKRHQCKYC